MKAAYHQISRAEAFVIKCSGVHLAGRRPRRPFAARQVAAAVVGQVAAAVVGQVAAAAAVLWGLATP